MKFLNSILLNTPATEGSWMSFLPLILIFVVMYFFMLRPQMKKQKDVRNFRDAVKKGDAVMTVSGVHGKVIEVKDTTVILEIAPNVKIKVEKSGIIANAADMPQQR